MLHPTCVSIKSKTARSLSVDFNVQVVKIILLRSVVPEQVQEEWFSSVHLRVKCSSVDGTSILNCLTGSILVERNKCELEI